MSVCSLGCIDRDVADYVQVSRSNYTSIRDHLEEGSEGGGAKKAIVAADPNGWATIQGKFTLNGSAPALPTLTVDKEREVCAPGGKPVYDEVITVDGDGNLGNVLIYLSSNVPADNPRWEHESYAATKNAVVEFDQKACIFLSRVACYRSSQTVKVLNSDPIGHNTNISPNGKAAAFNNTIAPNSSADYVPGGEARSPFSVSCSIHPWMKAYMFTRDHPYFAVTKPDGTFEIANLPAGVELEFRVWQELAGNVEKVSVSGDLGLSGPWKKGKFTVKLEAGKTYTLNAALDAASL